MAVQKKRSFVQRVLSYWVQKRLARNNVPLIRRLQVNPQPIRDSQTVSAAAGPQPEPPPLLRLIPRLWLWLQSRAETSQALKEQLKEWHRLRHDLERARLLLELIRKREKLKRDQVGAPSQTALDGVGSPIFMVRSWCVDGAFVVC